MVTGSGTSGGPPRLEAFLYVEGPERVLRFVVPEGDRQVVTRNSGAGKVGELASDWVGATPEDTLGASQVSQSFKVTLREPNFPKVYIVQTFSSFDWVEATPEDTFGTSQRDVLLTSSWAGGKLNI